jgi:AAT family amino acid transporter
MKFRRGLSDAERGRLILRVPFYPYASWAALAFLGIVTVLMAYFPDTRIALLVGPLWLVLLAVLYYALGLDKGKQSGVDDAHLSQGSIAKCE